jgi:hypothetical protein
MKNGAEVECPLMAHLGHCGVSRRSPLLDVKRTIASAGGMSQVDPNRTPTDAVANREARTRRRDRQLTARDGTWRIRATQAEPAMLQPGS